MPIGGTSVLSDRNVTQSCRRCQGLKAWRRDSNVAITVGTESRGCHSKDAWQCRCTVLGTVRMDAPPAARRRLWKRGNWPTRKPDARTWTVECAVRPGASPSGLGKLAGQSFFGATWRGSLRPGSAPFAWWGGFTLGAVRGRLRVPAAGGASRRSYRICNGSGDCTASIGIGNKCKKPLYVLKIEIVRTRMDQLR